MSLHTPSFVVLFMIAGNNPMLMDFANEASIERMIRGDDEPIVILPPKMPVGCRPAQLAAMTPGDRADFEADLSRRTEMVTDLRKRVEAKVAKLRKDGETVIVLDDDLELRQLQMEELCEAKLCRNAAGKLGIPGNALYATLRDAGCDVKLSGKTPITYRTGGTMLPYTVKLQDDFLAFDGAVTWKPDYRYLAKREARIKKADYRVTVRPRFEQWSVTGSAEVECEDGFTVEHFRKLLEQAGKSTGLGGMRGERHGYVCFGSFGLTGFEIDASTRRRLTFADFQNRSQGSQPEAIANK